MFVKVPIFHLLELIEVPTSTTIYYQFGWTDERNAERFRIAQHPMGESTNGEEDKSLAFIDFPHLRSPSQGGRWFESDAISAVRPSNWTTWLLKGLTLDTTAQRRMVRMSINITLLNFNLTLFDLFVAFWGNVASRLIPLEAIRKVSALKVLSSIHMDIVRIWNIKVRAWNHIYSYQPYYSHHVSGPWRGKPATQSPSAILGSPGDLDTGWCQHANDG